MVETVIEIIKREVPGVEVTEASYGERGYHLSVNAAKDTIVPLVKWFEGHAFYIEDMCCVDYLEYLEIVYFFNTYASPSRVKVTIKVEADNPRAPTVSRIYQGAYWYEREIHEFFGVLFENHPNLTNLFLHDGVDFYPLRKNRIPVSQEDRALLNGIPFQEQEDTFFVNMGPQHPSTHGVLRVVLKMDGEYIQEAIPVLGYGHRMHEKMGENRPYLQFFPNTARMDYLGVITFNVVYAAAVEKFASIPVPPRAQYARVITAELNRITSHLLWIGAYLADVGALTPFLYAFDDREKILDILEGVTGSRLTYCAQRFGGLYNDIDEKFVAGTKAFLDRMWKRLKIYEDLITGNVIFVNRTREIGIIDKEMARKYGVSGPVLRSTGIPYDMRKVEPYAAYGDLSFDVPCGQAGDCFDRYMIHIWDMEVSLKIIDQALSRLPDGPFVAEKVPKKVKPPQGDIYHTAESPRGEVGVYIVSDGSDTPYRMHWRVPSFSNVMPFSDLAKGTLIADAVAILGALDLCIPEIDR
jgi:NADH-quinone oxidoreductase subunit D